MTTDSSKAAGSNSSSSSSQRRARSSLSTASNSRGHHSSNAGHRSATSSSMPTTSAEGSCSTADTQTTVSRARPQAVSKAHQPSQADSAMQQEVQSALQVPTCCKEGRVSREFCGFGNIADLDSSTGRSVSYNLGTSMWSEKKYT